MRMADKLYNVYAWHYGFPERLVAKEVSFTEAMTLQDRYLKKPNWDAYVIRCEEDFNYYPEKLSR